MRKTTGLAPIGAALLALAACSGGEAGNNGAIEGDSASGGAGNTSSKLPSETLAQAIGRTEGLAGFNAAMKSAGLEGLLSGAAPYTIFAPNDAAFGAPAGQALLGAGAKGKLSAALTGHVVPGTVTAKDLDAAIGKGGGKAQLATMAGVPLTASREGGAILLADGKGGKARIVRTDLIGSNGVVHVVDGLLPPR